MHDAPGPAVPPRAFHAREAVAVARDLVGAGLRVGGARGTIVETEAYGPGDPASHGYRGPTARNASMSGPPGHACVYRAYGIRWRLNLACGGRPGSAVLVRALEPRAGLGAMRARRGTDDIRRLSAGPGRLCRALGVAGAHDGLPLDEPPFVPEAGPGPAGIVEGVRIGVTRGVELPWRFGLNGSRFPSRPFARCPDG